MTSRPTGRLLTVVGFLAVFAGGFVYYWIQAGGDIPGVTSSDDYRVSFASPDTKNLLDNADVTMAGVRIGHVEKMDLTEGGARVELALDDNAAPLHRGATARIGVKSLLGSSYVDIKDGNGPVLPSETTLPKSAVKEATDLEDIVASLDPRTRAELSGAIQSLARTTEGTDKDLGRIMEAVGDLGREGYTVMDAIADQSTDLRALTRESAILMQTLDTGRGRIATMVRDANTLTKATAGQRRALEQTMRAMPPLLTNAKAAVGKVRKLSGSLAPIAADLKAAAPGLNDALMELPAVTDDLRGLLPSLDGTLRAAPSTLSRIPTFGSDVRNLIPHADLALRDVNPMLAYLKPYGRDIGAMFANFGASLDVVSENGVRPVRLASIFNDHAIKGVPAPLTLNPLHWTNPYPAAGAAGDPAPFKGKYPRLEREPK